MDGKHAVLAETMMITRRFQFRKMKTQETSLLRAIGARRVAVKKSVNQLVWRSLLYLLPQNEQKKNLT